MGAEEFARLARALGFRGKRKPKPASAAPAHHTPAHNFGATMHAANVAAVGQRHHSKAEAEALSAKAWDKGWDSAHEAAAGAWRHVAERAPTAAEYNAAVASLKAHWRHLDRLHPSAHKLPTRPKAARKPRKPKAAKPKAAKKAAKPRKPKTAKKGAKKAAKKAAKPRKRKAK